MPYSTVTRTLHSAIWTQNDLETPNSEIGGAIVQAFGKLAFASVKELARRLCCVPTTMLCHLTESLHFASKHLQWVPHDLTPAQKALWIEKSNALLRLIESVRHKHPALLATLDECWFYFR
jgi:hypothetical protein